MPIRIAFEFGHLVQLRKTVTAEGFTHDWELFVRGGEGANISCFVEKVVFNLHESFPRPRRSKCFVSFSVD